MKSKILFISLNYPYGPFGPSTKCMAQVMEALSRDERYDIYNLSYEGKVNNYKEIIGVNIKTIPLHAPLFPHSRIKIICRWIISSIFYPFSNFFFCRKVFCKCKKVIADTQFDLVIAQCNPEESVWSATWLKRAGIGKKLMIVFWDNIYGRLQFKYIPTRYAMRRQIMAERFVARSSDLLVSLYPIKSFHEKNGDIPDAISKRVYLGIPTISKPIQRPTSSYQKVIRQKKINLLFSGTLFCLEHIEFVINLFNKLKCAAEINLILFERGVDINDILALRAQFQGNIEVNDWIPMDDLLSLYPFVDFFLSFPGLLTAVRSKVYDYMSYGKPLFLFYNNEEDVNIGTFSQYPAQISVDMRVSAGDLIHNVDSFINSNFGKNVPFEVTESLFPKDSINAYLRVIDELLTNEVNEQNSI